MQSHWANAAPYYRCRFPAEYALANHVEHPLSMSLREDAIIGQVDGWLALEFTPHRLAETIRDLAAAQQPDRARNASGDGETEREIADWDGKQPSSTPHLMPGASPATVAAWIAEIEAERATYTLGIHRTEPRPRRMTEAEIRAIVDKLADIAGVLRDAEPETIQTRRSPAARGSWMVRRSRTRAARRHMAGPSFCAMHGIKRC